jgi:hypothetical protein
VRCQHAPSFWREKGGFSRHFLIENLFPWESATSSGTGLGHAIPLSQGIDEGSCPVSRIPGTAGRLP